jgi:hypothetical protein
MVKINTSLIVSAVIYLAIVLIIYFSNITQRLNRDRQVLMYYIIGIIIPIFIYLIVILLFFFGWFAVNIL